VGSATITTLDQRIPAYIEKIAKRDPFWQGGDRRHRHRARFELAFELDGQPAAALQGPAEGPDRRRFYGLFVDRPATS
jgi:hypothetical protein